jgi:hypothetical protein
VEEEGKKGLNEERKSVSNKHTHKEGGIMRYETEGRGEEGRATLIAYTNSIVGPFPAYRVKQTVLWGGGVEEGGRDVERDREHTNFFAPSSRCTGGGTESPICPRTYY